MVEKEKTQNITQQDFLLNNENIHKTGNFVHPHNILSTKLDQDYLQNLNAQINTKENIIHKTILDHSVRDIISNFTNDIVRLIDDIMTDIEEMNKDYDDGDTLDWMVKLLNTIYKIFNHLIHKNNCLNVGILLIIISLFVHYFNITQSK
jgi:hypothetical protein